MLLLRSLTTDAPEASGLQLRRDDAAMPPPPKMVAWLKLKPQGSFGRPSSVFAMLGRQKLLLFADALCTNLKQLVTLEPGGVSLHHEMGDAAFELTLDPMNAIAPPPTATAAARQQQQPPPPQQHAPARHARPRRPPPRPPRRPPPPPPPRRCRRTRTLRSKARHRRRRRRLL